MVGPEGLQVLEKLLPDAAEETAGSTAGWAGGLTFASAQPGGCEPGRWPWTRPAAASCGWGTQSCGGRGSENIITKGEKG